MGQLRSSAQEVGLHLSSALLNKKHPREVIFPYGAKQKNPESLLRAYVVGSELRKHYGWRIVVVPPRFSLAQRLRIINFEKPNLILMQMEQHTLSRPSLYSPIPVVFDIDDADFFWLHAIDRVEKCCGDVIAGSQYLVNWVSNYNSKIKVI